MSITFTKAYVSNGMTFATLKEAQINGITSLLLETGVDAKIAATCAEMIVARSEMAVNILTTTEKSRPKARAVNGGRKPRKSRITEPATTTAA